MPDGKKDIKQNYRREAMLRVFFPIGFDLIFIPNTHGITDLR